MALIARLQAGDRAAARAGLLALAGELAPDDHFHRCVLAHHLADAQDDPAEELRWDLVALEAARGAPPEAFDGRFPGVSLAGFLPSPS